MVREAEEFADEDKATKERIEAKNAFESYIYSVTSAAEKTLADKLDDDEKDELKQAVEDAQSWLAENPDADAEEIKEKNKEVEETCAPIISKHYGGAGEAGGAADDDDDDDDHDEL